VLIALEGVVGGTLRHLDCLLRYADPREFDIHLAVSARRAPHVREDFRRWSEAGWRVHDIPMQREPRPADDLRAFREILSLCRRERFDVMHTHCAKAGFLGRLAGRLTGARTIHTPHVFPFSHVGGERARAVFLAAERLAARWTDRFVLLSNFQLNVLLETRLADAGRAVIVPNGIVPEEFAGREQHTARRELGLGEGARVALFAGRFCAQKGLDVLLDAAAPLRGRVPAAQIVIVGEGPLERRLRRQVAARALGDVVSVHGRTDRMPLYYAACDLLVMPSRAEGMPYVLLEAKAAARPTVATLVCGMEEFITHGVDGFLVPPENPDALAATLSQALAEPEVLREMGARARESFRDAWRADRSAHRTYELYRDVAAGGRS